MNLLLDSKTRWNSLYSMLERFVKLQKCVRMALIDIGTPIPFSSSEIDLIRELISALEPVKYGVEALCRQDATLLTSERIHKFVLEKLDSQNTNIANKLKDSLQSRIDSRRNMNLIHLYEYLNDHTFLKNSEGSSRPKRQSLIKLAVMLLQRLIKEHVVEEETEELEMNPISNEALPPPEAISLKEQLEQTINSVKVNFGEQFSVESGKILDKKQLQKEFEIYEATGNKTSNLKILFNALSTIQPTSVESERAFSACGLFLSKLRSSLKDSTIDCLCFLRGCLK